MGRVYVGVYSRNFVLGIRLFFFVFCLRVIDKSSLLVYDGR